MAILQVIGATGSIQQSVGKSWNYLNGEVSQTVYKGVYASVEALYNSYKAVAGSAPSIDSLQLTYQRGTGVLTVSTIEDGTPQYELIGNELSNPVWTHSHFAALTAAEIEAVRRDFEQGLGGTFTGTQLELWNMLSQGTEEYLVSSYVLRETKQVSKKSNVTASYTDVNKVMTPPNTSAVNALIGSLPPGEWLKKTPQVRLIGSKRWQISTEWWWAEKWSSILYSGSGTP
jgi:hypothetical protein